jgi:molecular chaperone GrpE (heat shock protein)
MDNVNVVMTVVVALVSGTGGWSILQFILNRTGRKAEIARQHAETEKIKEDVEANNRKVLAAAQIAAQQAALESSRERYSQLRNDYDESRREFAELRDSSRLQFNDLRSATEELIDIMETFLSQVAPKNGDDVIIIPMTTEDYRAARTAIRLARSHLY